MPQVRRRGAPLLARVQNNRVFRPLRRLGDGSYLAKLSPSPRHRDRDDGGVVVRISEYTLSDPGRPGWGEQHRLLTPLRGVARQPAKRLIVLSQERGEEELPLDEIKTQQRERPVLPRETPAGVVQAIPELLLAP